MYIIYTMYIIYINIDYVISIHAKEVLNCNKYSDTIILCFSYNYIFNIISFKN